MNTFLLAAVAIALVAFLVFNRKRQAAAGAAPDKEPTRASSRGRGLKRGRGRKIDGYPEMSEAPATAVAETAASRTVAPVLEPLPPAESVADPISPVPSAAAIADWGFDEMIVEPGWPLPGEMSAAGWPGDVAMASAPVAAPAVALASVAEPVAVDEAPVDEASTGEWTMPSAEPYAASEPSTAEPLPAVATDADAPAMEAWVPGMTEVEPVTLPEPEPADAAAEAESEAAFAPAEEPQLVWTDPVAAESISPESIPPESNWTTSTSTGSEPIGSEATEPDAPGEADVVAGPPPWRPQTFETPAPEPEALAEADPEPELPAWTPEPFAPVDAPVAEDAPWQPEAVTVHTVTETEAEAAAETDAVAEALPRAVAALTPAGAADDARGVTPRMAAVLRVLAREPRALPDLARALDLSRAVVTDLVSRLEELKLVRQEPDPDERRRRMIVVATLKGLWLARESVPSLDRDAVAGALGRLSPAERAALVAALRVLQEA